MHVVALVVGLLLIGLTLFDGFETILLPRRLNRRIRYARLYYQVGWSLWRPVFADFGGWGKADKDFSGMLLPLITEINAAVAA